MENFYKCVVDNEDLRRNVIISTNKTFPTHFHKSEQEQFEDLKVMAYEKVIANAISNGFSIDRNKLTFVYYKKMTKIEVEMEEFEFEEDWFEDDDFEDDWFQ